MIGQLNDAGNTTTVASYINVLSSAFMVTSLERYSGSKIKQKGSIPKIVLFDNSIANVLSGRDYKAATQDTEHWGHLVENAVGSVLYSLCKEKGAEIFYWRERDYEVDYIVKYGDKLIAIEVKSGKKIKDLSGLNIFKDRHEKAISLVISSTKEHIENHKIIDLEEYLLNPEIVFNIR